MKAKRENTWHHDAIVIAMCRDARGLNKAKP